MGKNETRDQGFRLMLEGVLFWAEATSLPSDGIS